jgi:hypothetical protein
MGHLRSPIALNIQAKNRSEASLHCESQCTNGLKVRVWTRHRKCFLPNACGSYNVGTARSSCEARPLPVEWLVLKSVFLCHTHDHVVEVEPFRQADRQHLSVAFTHGYEGMSHCAIDIGAVAGF